jgi:hypothetical protein
MADVPFRRGEGLDPKVPSGSSSEASSKDDSHGYSHIASRLVAYQQRESLGTRLKLVTRILSWISWIHLSISFWRE